MLRQLCILVTFALGISVFAETNAFLVFDAADVFIYSGPSTKFRPIMLSGKGQRVGLAPQKVPALREVGEFFKVIVEFKGDSRLRFGYVSTLAPAHIEAGSGLTNIEKASAYVLAKNQIQLQLITLKGRSYEWDIGYVRFLLPNFYIKFLGGQVINLANVSFLTGGEVGIDHSFLGAWSIFTLFSSGVFFPSSDDALFIGAGSLSYFGKAGGGLRYSPNEYASVAVGVATTSFFNANNSFNTVGLLVSFEVGL